MADGGGQGISEQVQWEKGKKKVLDKKEILELIILKKKKKRKHEYIE